VQGELDELPRGGIQQARLVGGDRAVLQLDARVSARSSAADAPSTFAM
jgi:hypothetical protein